MLTFKAISLWIHIAAIVVWAGGLFAVYFVIVPVLRKGISSAQDAARLVAMVMQRFQRISREIIFIIILTGIFNVMHAGMARGFDFSAGYLRVLVTKIILFVIIIAIQTWQTVRLAPALVSATSQMDQGASSLPGPAARLQRQALLTSILNVVLAVFAILLGLGLRYE